MKLPECDREPEVVDALRSGRWSTGWCQELRQHTATCSVCAEVVFITQQFQREMESARAELQAGAGLPSAGLVWWKAQRAARRAAAQRAAEPIVWVERAAGALATLAAVALGIWQWPRLSAWLHRTLVPSPSAHVSALPANSSGADGLHQLAQVWASATPLFLLAASIVALLSLMAFALYDEWRED